MVCYERTSGNSSAPNMALNRTILFIFTVILSLVTGAAHAEGECPVAPPPVKELRTVSVYSDALGSIIDFRKEQSNSNLRQPIEDFTSSVVQLSDDAARVGDDRMRRCVLRLVDTWAREGSLLGSNFSNQGNQVRIWAAGQIAASLIKIGSTEDTLPGNARDWLVRLRQELIVYWRTRVEARGERAFNNIQYWHEYSLAALSIVLGDLASLENTKTQFHLFMQRIGPDGTLAFELKRGRRAALYHAFAGQALTGLRVLLAGTGFGVLSDEDDAALSRLAILVDAAHDDTQYITELTKLPQVQIGSPGWTRLVKVVASSKQPNRGDGDCVKISTLR